MIRAGRRTGWKMVAAAALALLLATAAGGQPGEWPGVLHGRLHSADHPDSILAGTPVELFFRGEDEEIHRHVSVTDATGRYVFTGLDTTATLAYVLRVQRGSARFLSEPVFFPAGRESLEYSVQLTTNPAGLPPGHPPTGPPQGRRPPERPGLAGLILLSLALGYGLLFHLTREKPREARERRYPAEVRAYFRDLAALDLRRERDEIGEEEYRKIRSRLRERLIELLKADPPPV